MAKVYDREDEEYLTCWHRECTKDGDDRWYLPVPDHEDDYVEPHYIFCSQAHMDGFVEDWNRGKRPGGEG